jgi:hypothetical protein
LTARATFRIILGIVKAQRHRVALHLGVFLSVALALLPLALSAHSHSASDRGMRGFCDLCMAAHHTPAGNYGIELPAAPIPSFGSAPVSLPAPAWVSVPRPSGRAPPSASQFA